MDTHDTQTAHDKTDRPTLLTEPGFCHTLLDTASPIFSLSDAYFPTMKISSQKKFPMGNAAIHRPVTVCQPLLFLS